jgi:hypothetical protein
MWFTAIQVHVTYSPFRVIVFSFYFELRTAAFKAYCAIWVRRFKFRHQASPRVSTRESTKWRKVQLWARNVQYFCLNVDLHFTFRDLSHAVKLRHGTDGWEFFALKIRRLRPGANPRTWLPKASQHATSRATDAAHGQSKLLLKKIIE